jgi:predicted dehydrogenase
MIQSKIRWGILSTAKIGIQKLIPAMQKSKYCNVTAIASRNITTAQKTASSLNIPKAYGSYPDLLADPEIDVIYNPLPNHLHVPLTIKALEAGKHVLCEKPLAPSSEEANLLLKTSKLYPQLKVMEAFMYRFHPQWKIVKEIIHGGTIGELKTIRSFFSYYNTNPNDIRNQFDIGGGGLLDIGCYCISLSRFIFEKEPTKVTGNIERDPKFKTDCLASGILEFPNGTSTFTCSTQLAPFQRAHISGTSGHIEIEIPFTPSPDKPCKLWLHTNDTTKEILIDKCDQYTLQCDEFSLSILNNTSVPTSLDDAISNQKIIDALFKSAENKSWIIP